MENYSENSIKSDMQNSLQIFKYCDQKVRTVTKNGEVFFVLKDVCNVLELSNSRKVSDRLDDDEKDVTFGYTPGGSQNLTIINESGLYKVIFRSNKPEAKKFMHWVTHEVLPSIRKHGAYITTQKMEELMQNPETWTKLIQTLQQERQEKQKLQDQIEADKPKVLFADAVATSESDVLIGELAKILKGNGIEIGQNRLFEKLRQDGFLIRRDGSDYNTPTQKAMNLGLFKLKETAITHSDGHITISKTTKVTGKGQQYFVQYFMAESKKKAEAENAAA